MVRKVLETEHPSFLVTDRVLHTEVPNSMNFCSISEDLVIVNVDFDTSHENGNSLMVLVELGLGGKVSSVKEVLD